jgi:hypothetical protein
MDCKYTLVTTLGALLKRRVCDSAVVCAATGMVSPAKNTATNNGAATKENNFEICQIASAIFLDA